MDYRNVKGSPSDLSEMQKLTRGGSNVPVILDAGNVTVGYGGT